MSYAGLTDLAGRLGASVFEAFFGRDESGALEALAGASAEVDGYVGARYAVPVASARAQGLLRDWTLTLAAERVYVLASGAALPDKVATRAEEARRQLRDCAKGLLRLPGAAELGSGGQDGLGGAGAAMLEIEQPVFGRRKMRGY